MQNKNIEIESLSEIELTHVRGGERGPVPEPVGPHGITPPPIVGKVPGTNVYTIAPAGNHPFNLNAGAGSNSPATLPRLQQYNRANGW